MRLSKLKLVGFKSFVQPTTLAFPGQRAAVVGPNGCGKSNVIDAVRWVMGESSAKHLRGESMSDVIFNGSAGRQAVSRAAVELLFDNQEGKIGGQFADYSEIAIKRQTTRDGQSQYFINGVRCRRRDITDLFYGTGLGLHSYAIIEQGMVSRLVDAKPDELRLFLEETAGISKYKERRRETQMRMQHTRDNLQRLTDIRDELDKQIQRLQRQCREAERYQELRQQKHQQQAELLALRWQDMQEQGEQQNEATAEKQQQLSAVQNELQALDANIAQYQQLHRQASDDLEQVQQTYYQLNTEIARLEEQSQHQEQQQQQLKSEYTQTETDLTVDQQDYSDAQNNMQKLTVDIKELRQKEQEQQAQLIEAEQRRTAAQQQLLSQQQLAHFDKQRASILEIQRQLDKLKQQLLQTQARHTSLQELQQHALKQPSKTMSDWLESHQLADKKRIFEQLQVEKGWELAVDIVLGHYLQAIGVENFDHAIEQLSQEQPPATLMLVRQATDLNTVNENTLFSKVKLHGLALSQYLEDIYIAEDWEEALTLREKLTDKQSVISKDGVWFGKEWLRIQRQQDVNAGILQRRSELKTLADALSNYEENIAKLGEQLTTEQENLQLAEKQHQQRIQQQLAEAEQSVKQCQEKLQHTQLTLQTDQAQLESLKHYRERQQERLSQLQQRYQRIKQDLQQVPEVSFDEQLQVKQQQLTELQQEVATARQKAEQYDAHLQDLRDKRQNCEARSNELRSQEQQLTIQAQEIRVRQQTITENLQEKQYDLPALLQELSEDANIEEYEKQLDKVTQSLERLGSVNLAAIEEYEEEAARKQKLDEQHQDLMDALELLERAMHKIDQETRTQFSETYQKVNQQFQQLFPRLFAGGRAHLQLTSDDLLTAGVTVMASPPGKRNSTIHQLSGGEKALTAISLVFAIFQLNPSPFCMLDEVDAPLDDTNVVRFCNLVNELSTSVQFVMITHNKITMELADHLSGITMHEPGVSRIVSVDVEQALALAEQ